MSEYILHLISANQQPIEVAFWAYTLQDAISYARAWCSDTGASIDNSYNV